MMLHLHELNSVISFLQAGKLEEATKGFVQSITDTNSTSLITNKLLTTDFATLEALFRLDQALAKINRNVFWETVAKNKSTSTSARYPAVH